MKVALYARVSTEEQARHGYSIETQIDTLKEYAEKNNYTIYDIYKDEGFSGAKINRPALTKLLDDIKAHKIDCVLFCYLDRWFRSVKQYYKIQEVLDENNVTWKCILEDYETTTPEGIFKVNIMLAVSQQFRDVTSAKVKHSMDNKVKNGFYVTKPAYGYKLQRVDGGTILAKDENTEHIVNKFYELYRQYNSIRKCLRFIFNEYGIDLSRSQGASFIDNEIYAGIFKGMENYCPAYVTREEQLSFSSSRIKYEKPNRKHDYLFTGMIKCPICGGKTTTTHVFSRKVLSYGYRCDAYARNRSCSNSKIYREQVIEKHILDNLSEYISQDIYVIKKKNEEVNNKDAERINTSIMEQQKRLKDLYIKGHINEEEYDYRFNELESQKVEIKEIDYKPLESLLEGDILGMYNLLSDDKKRVFWAKIVDKIEIIDNGTYEDRIYKPIFKYGCSK